MEPSTSLMLLSRPPGLPLLRMPDRHIANGPPPAIKGPGRILNNVYSAAGETIGNGVNHLAHKLGMGPVAITNRIEDALGHRELRETRLDNLFFSLRDEQECTIPGLERDCMKLMSLALP
jgi:hypothetical protein